MKKFITLIISILTCLFAQSQTAYTAAMFANTGDTFYITTAQPDTTNFYKTSANYSWNFAKLKGISQQQLVFRSPKATGFTQVQWPYIYNANNVNLSSTNNQSVNIGTLQESNSNDYFLKTSATLAQKASSFNIAYSNVALNVKNVYSQADTVYKFPLNYNDTFASNGVYTTTIPGIYYNAQTVNRTNKIDGWGSITTPYGTFNNCLRITSEVIQIDTFAFAGIGIPSVTVRYRELKWLDASKGYPVLYVKQVLTGTAYVTQSVEYLDVQQYFTPQALFAFVPLVPVKGDTVTFQNLSTNSTSYLWYFGDGATSTLVNPQHVYATAGKYAVKLVAYNGPHADSILINITVTESTLPLQLLSFTGENVKGENALQWVTANEINFGYFSVERSTNGNNFTSLASITAAGTSNENIEYSFYDKTPLQGNNFYRLKMIDKNGNYTYSKTILVQSVVQALITTSLSPNPVKQGQQTTLIIQAATYINAALRVADVNGKIQATQNIHLSPGNNTIYVNTNNLTPGVYFINCTGGNNNIIQRQKIIVAY